MWQYNHTPESDELMHYGILGMKWGKRRYQNKDGSLTPLGKRRLKDDTPTNRHAEKLATNAARKVRTEVDYDKAHTDYYTKPFADKKQLNRAGNDVLDKLNIKGKAGADFEKSLKSYLKKYEKIDVSLEKEVDTGETYVRASLQDKAGKIYVSEIYTGLNNIKPIRS